MPDSMPACVLTTQIDAFPLWRRGKVRDVYDLGDRLLIVATDRLSAFDVVLPTGIPGKGVLLTQISLFWFRLLADIVPHHVLTSDVSEYDAALAPYRDVLAGRSMIVEKTDVFPVECVVRGYLSGSGWKDYRRSGSVCGISLPEGLVESQQLPRTLFTPATKAEQGAHDENISFAEMERIVGGPRARELQDVSIAIYERARIHAASNDLILADTKFEFGLKDEGLVWVDEALTPDSSRFWPADGYAAGGPQPSFDKQYVRDYLESLSWDKRPPGPELPPEVVRRTLGKYREACTRLTGAAPW